VQAHLAPRRRRFVAKACSAASRRLGTVDIQITSAICMSTDPSVVSWNWVALRFDQAVMIVRPSRRGDTGWYRPTATGVRGRRLVDPLRGGSQRHGFPTHDPGAAPNRR
jgi:hypothetical protein